MQITLGTQYNMGILYRNTNSYQGIIYIQYATKCQMILVQMYNIFRL